MDRPYKHFNPIYRAMEEWQREFMQQDHDIEALAKGAANQAKTIRTLDERNSQLEAEVTTRAYQIELIKGQGRKTRDKVRALKKALADSQNHLGQALTRAEQAEELLEQRERIIGEQQASIRELDSKAIAAGKLVQRHQDAIDRIQRGKELTIQYVTKADPFTAERVVVMEPGAARYHAPSEPFIPASVRHFERTVVRVMQTACAFHVAPEHMRDVRAHAEIAQTMARGMVPKIEQSILNALRGEETEMPDLRKLQYQEMQMRQQRQLYSDLPYSGGNSIRPNY